MRIFVQVGYVTPNYVGVAAGVMDDPLVLVHKSQVTGAPQVGDWVEVQGTGLDMHVRGLGATVHEIAPATALYAVAL